MSVVVTYDSNNSGGSWWLADGDWDKLAAAGWNIHWGSRIYSGDPLAPVEDKGERWLGARAVAAAKAFDDPADAIREFEEITGQDASAEGCNCCGPPHSFAYADDEGRSHYATARVVKTAIDFDP